MPAGRTAHREVSLPGTPPPAVGNMRPLSARHAKRQAGRGFAGHALLPGAVLRHTARGLAIESPGHSP